ncbi:hypothetical protein F2Q69_00020968 [Brassica cretica]|uniref:Uncharacterized protein n=1 Tax=Brassica cretica TaxID=69181 RepID=A0A8S9QBP8_BRACR|nr:hypothetical protein F2Q69_00020968 [Brassica cretica]
MTVTWQCRDSREMGYHARRLDLICRPFQDRVVEIKSSWPGVDYVVEIELPESGETLENVRPGYCGAYVSHFEDGGLSFPLPRFLLEVLAEIKIAFTQMAPNCFRYFLGCWVRAQKEGLQFSLRELRQLFAIKQNSGFPGTMILAPRGGRGIIEGIPNRDDRWREKFFIFKINPASVGDFDFERIPREWSNDIAFWVCAYNSRASRVNGDFASTRWLAYALPPGVNRATPVALVAPVQPKRGWGAKRKNDEEVLLDRPNESSEAGSSERTRTVHRGWVLRLSSQAQSPGLPARPVSVVIPSGGAHKAPDTSASSAGDRALDDEIDSSENPILENPESLATIWRKIRAKGCEVPSLEHMRERVAYVWMAVANAKAMEASNDYAALMEGRLTNFPSKEEIAGNLLTIQQLRGELDTAREAERQSEVDFEELRKKMATAEAEKVIAQRDLNSMEEKYRRDIEGRDRKARKDLHLARVSLAKEYEGALAVVRGKFEQKKKEAAAEILLQETRARIEALTEYSEGGFELEAELERLKDLEISLDVDYGLASVSDFSLGRLDLPEISGDLVNQD